MAKVTYFEALKGASLAMKKRDLDPATADYLMRALTGFDQTQLLIHYRDSLPEQLKDQFEAAVSAYLAGVSPQYIIGTADFYGYQFSVTPSVLIPRQETEELVAWLLADYANQAQLTILDVGTGSGAIGLTLKKERPDWLVSISDISAAAMTVARKNAVALGVEVTERVGNLLTPFTGDHFDAVVMNPPYIAREATPLMDQSVIESEPSLALFADHHGLAVYEQLAQQLKQGIVMTNRLYLEIGFDQGETVQTLFQTIFPDAQIRIRQDMAGHDRMVRVIFNPGNGE
ncbi:peptide chain release factor N(5)-glutamine methyltransferase [Secundilactobacillus kimchicus]|uniref:Release factor glutamine methyltransferase n=2 Tax=Secundilactobacillus kimchicus TaxID=528209 RepID=A0A0R1HXS4_9LACO|nr:peptide chain release factor N(5)-glutamine methyltransferase [Secundilactobacillus kimchicus]KRK48218.1 N5-glutamine S-adenosyl-L-methionine-dependent methyltransferase [Secundilactobacillus kimchicus JCM 15530]MBT9670821.1 peptide chain release factor N(5)-glutamine methyltransferase [Secundilactobacillus kimchicus]